MAPHSAVCASRTRSLVYEWCGTGMQVFCRIDHHLATPDIAVLARRESIYPAQRFSDHAPLVIDNDFSL